jgi:hypothetical protein
MLARRVGLQAAGTYSLLAALRGKTKLKFIVLMLVFTWLLIAGIVFQSEIRVVKSRGLSTRVEEPTLLCNQVPKNI